MTLDEAILVAEAARAISRDARSNLITCQAAEDMARRQVYQAERALLAADKQVSALAATRVR